MGPFVFIKRATKERVQFHDGSVTYFDYTYFLPCPEKTPLSLDTAITTLNLPLVGAVERIAGWAPSTAARWLSWLARAVEAWSGADVRGLFTTRTVAELLWGYDDPLLAKLHWLAPQLDPHFSIVKNMTGVDAAVERGPLTVHVGSPADAGAFWQLQQWRGITQVMAWAPPHVERVRGGDGLQFDPGMRVNDTALVWVGEIFRAVSLVAAEPARLHGVPLLRLRSDPHEGDVDPRYYQYIRGLMNVTAIMASGTLVGGGAMLGFAFWECNEQSARLLSLGVVKCSWIT